MTTLFQCQGRVVEPSYVSSDCCFHLISWNLLQNTGNWWSQETSLAWSVNSRKIKLWLGKHKQIIDSSAAVAAGPAYQFAINFSIISLGLIAIFLTYTWHRLHPWACWAVLCHFQQIPRGFPTNTSSKGNFESTPRSHWSAPRWQSQQQPRRKRTAVSSPGGRNDASPSHGLHFSRTWGILQIIQCSSLKK